MSCFLFTLLAYIQQMGIANCHEILRGKFGQFMSLFGLKEAKKKIVWCVRYPRYPNKTLVSLVVIFYHYDMYEICRADLQMLQKSSGSTSSIVSVLTWIFYPMGFISTNSQSNLLCVYFFTAGKKRGIIIYPFFEYLKFRMYYFQTCVLLTFVLMNLSGNDVKVAC